MKVFLYGTTPTVTRDTRVKNFGEHLTLIHSAECLAEELSLPFFDDLGLSRPGLEHPIIRTKGERSSNFKSVGPTTTD